jgi:polar amino acid transport system substrate-binding protein
MRLMRRSGWLAACGALLWLLLMAAPAHAQAQAPIVTLRVAAQEGTEPKFISGGPGRIIGLCVDLFRTIERIDPGLIFVGDQQWMPLPRTISELAGHQHDALCAVQRTPERARQFLYLDTPLFTLNYMLLARANDPVVINHWDDVRKLGAQGVVLVNRGYTTAEMLEQIGGLQINSSASSPVINLQKLLAGRGRFFLHRGPGLQGFLQRAGVAGKVRVLPQVMFHTSTYMAMGTHVDPAVVARVRRALEQMERTGELARLLKKWD